METEKRAVSLTEIYGHAPTIFSLALLGICVCTIIYVATTGDVESLNFATSDYRVLDNCRGAVQQILIGYLVAYRYPSILLIVIGIGSVVFALARRQSGARFIGLCNSVFLIPVVLIHVDWLVMISSPSVSAPADQTLTPLV